MHTRYAPVRHSRSPEGPLTVRLACIRPAASVHPEPGSNSSLYYCLSQIFLLYLGFRLDVLFGVPSYRFLASRRITRRWSCAGLRLSKNFAPGSPLVSLSFLPKAGAKVLPFPHSASFFFNYFLFFLQLTDLQLINFSKKIVFCFKGKYLDKKSTFLRLLRKIVKGYFQAF